MDSPQSIRCVNRRANALKRIDRMRKSSGRRHKKPAAPGWGGGLEEAGQFKTAATNYLPARSASSRALALAMTSSETLRGQGA